MAVTGGSAAYVYEGAAELTKYVTREGKVAIFLSAAQSKPDFNLAWGCMIEECAELAEAAKDYTAESNDVTRSALVKELADVQYVLSQLAIFYGVNLEEAFDRVALNNLTKVEGGVRFRDDGKILKPDGYVKPDMGGL